MIHAIVTLVGDVILLRIQHVSPFSFDVTSMLLDSSGLLQAFSSGLLPRTMGHEWHDLGQYVAWLELQGSPACSVRCQPFSRVRCPLEECRRYRTVDVRLFQFGFLFFPMLCRCPCPFLDIVYDSGQTESGLVVSFGRPSSHPFVETGDPGRVF